VVASERRTVGWQKGCRCSLFHGVEPAVVLDMFSGAGTTGVAARRLGRRYIGIELNPAYAEISRRRIRESSPGR
jgi:tRNA/tmRNA/rRNA uracil-C5-methylase (TrmA/RlmC/RlmD family)